MPAINKPDVTHDEPDAKMPRHKPEYSDMCEICGPRIERGQRINKFHRSLVEFGYAGLTMPEVAEAYDLAINPKHVIGPYDNIITRLIRTQLAEAGLVVVEE